MTRIFASALALTLAAPVMADTSNAAAAMSNPGEPVVMDDQWDTEMAAFEAPDITREGWKMANQDELTTEELTGMRVYDANDEWIGEIDNIVVNTSGEIQGAVLGVGGFLGIGEKDVLVSFDSLTIKSEDEGDDLRVYAGMTKTELEELPAYDS